jgi:hypothetical protein
MTLEIQVVLGTGTKKVARFNWLKGSHPFSLDIYQVTNCIEM